jgi:hypothetical protein
MLSKNHFWCGDTRPIPDFTSIAKNLPPGNTPTMSLTPGA